MGLRLRRKCPIWVDRRDPSHLHLLPSAARWAYKTRRPRVQHLVLYLQPNLLYLSSSRLARGRIVVVNNNQLFPVVIANMKFMPSFVKLRVPAAERFKGHSGVDGAVCRRFLWC